MLGPLVEFTAQPYVPAPGFELIEGVCRAHRVATLLPPHLTGLAGAALVAL